MTAGQNTRAWVVLWAVLSISLGVNGWLLSRLIDRFDSFDLRLRMVETAIAVSDARAQLYQQPTWSIP